MEWKYFELKQLKEAKEFAAEGGIAVHQNNASFGRYRQTAHLFCKDRETLLKVGEELGLEPKWVHKDHFDLFGRPLYFAKVKCGIHKNVE